MTAKIVQVPAIRVAMVRHTGPYEQLSQVFDNLFRWVDARNVPVQRTIGLYWDNPEFVAANQLRSAAAVEVPINYQLNDTGGLPLELFDISPGSYVATKFIGPYEDLEPIWSSLIRHTENNLRRTITDDPTFEVYVNDPADTAPKDLITELYLPIS